MEVKDVYMVGREVVFKQGNLMRFWKYHCFQEIPLCVQLPAFFDICQDQECTIAKFVSQGHQLPFRCRLYGDNLANWNLVVENCQNLKLVDESDTISWSLSTKNIFNTRSVYKWLESGIAGDNNRWIWKASIPLKIKKFMWQLMQNSILTRDNLKKMKVDW